MTPSKSPLISIVFLFLQMLNVPENYSCAPATTESSSFSIATFDLQPLRSCTSDCQCTKAYGKEARCIGGKCFCLSAVLGAAQKVPQNESSILTATITSMIAQDCFKLAESRASASSVAGGNSSSAGNAWSELVSSQREAERYRITWAAVFIFILCAIAAIFHVYQAD